MPDALSSEYARALSSLEGNEFEAEVCACLEAVILGFQRVPSQPQGDAGLDGISHNGERAYCCYGPEHKAYKNNREREKAIIAKFTSDLRRLFELETKGKGVVHHDNPELATILPKGQRIQKITLIVSEFDSHRVIGPILTKANEYRAASACQHVTQAVEVVIQGAKDLGDAYPVNELSVDRARRRDFERKMLARAEAVTVDDPRTFEKKMAVLAEIRPDRPDAVKTLAEGLRQSWRKSLAFELELTSTVPALHESLDGVRQRISMKVSALIVASSTPWKELAQFTAIAVEGLKADFGSKYGSVIEDVASGEVARLIGECTIDWQRPA